MHAPFYHYTCVFNALSLYSLYFLKINFVFVETEEYRLTESKVGSWDSNSGHPKHKCTTLSPDETLSCFTFDEHLYLSSNTHKLTLTGEG